MRERLGRLPALVFPLPDTSVPPPPLPFPVFHPLPFHPFPSEPEETPHERPTGRWKLLQAQTMAPMPMAPPPALGGYTLGQPPPPAPAPLVLGPKPARCRFWPKCSKDNCPFVHPTKQCTYASPLAHTWLTTQ